MAFDWANLARTVCVVAVFGGVVALPVVLNTAIAGRKRPIPEIRLHIRGTADECPVGGLERVFQVGGPGGWFTLATVQVGDCVSLPQVVTESFRLCCIDETRCVDYYVPCTEPPQCVSEYPL